MTMAAARFTQNLSSTDVPTAQTMSEMLEALKGEERALPMRPVLRTNRQDRVFKDW